MEREKDPLHLLKWPPFAMLLVVIIIALYAYLQVYPTKTETSFLMYPKLKLQDAFFKVTFSQKTRPPGSLGFVIYWKPETGGPNEETIHGRADSLCLTAG